MPPIQSLDVVPDAEATSTQASAIANQACTTCRRQRRKCTKEVPACLLCRRLGRPCVYSDDLPTRSNQDEIAYLRSKIASLEGQLTGVPLDTSGSSVSLSTSSIKSSDYPSPSARYDQLLYDPPRRGFPAMFFLDSVAFKYEKQEVIQPDIYLPQEFFTHTEELLDTAGVVDSHFDTVHTFFPIVSKLHLRRQIVNHVGCLPAATKLLLLCMQLSNHSHDFCGISIPKLYKFCKVLYVYLEGQNVFSIQLIQAALLIALYEIAGAIYPAAYFTMGHCARLGHAMGLHNQKSCLQMLPSPVTWTEAEERRRVWWAVIMLERYVNIGNRNHPFACEDPRADDLLPTDDEKWDKGEMNALQPLVISTNTTVRASRFARMCQASHLLSRVLCHVDDRSLDSSFRCQEALQLRRTTEALSSTLKHEVDCSVQQNSVQPRTQTMLLTSLALCYSAQLSLYERYCCVDTGYSDEMGTSEQLELQNLAITGLQEVSVAVLELTRWIKSSTNAEGLSRISPLVMDCLYQAAANFAWLKTETGEQAHYQKLAEIKHLLDILSVRWNAAIEYIKILEIKT